MGWVAAPPAVTRRDFPVNWAGPTAPAYGLAERQFRPTRTTGFESGGGNRGVSGRRFRESGG